MWLLKKHIFNCHIFCLVKMSRNFDQQIADWKMLRTDSFTHAALDAVSSPAAAAGNIFVAFLIAVFMVEQMVVIDSEEIRNMDVHRTAVFFHAITAVGARDRIDGMEYFYYLFHCFMFLFAQRLEVLHVTDVINELIKSAHTG